MSPLTKHQYQKYQQLLIILGITFVVSPFLQAGIGSGLMRHHRPEMRLAIVHEF